MWRIWSSSSSDLVLLAMLCVWMLPPAVSPANIHHGAGGNPANELVALINANRTASKLPPLRNSAGLGCMALQYISQCMASNGGDACTVAVACQPPETDITEVYAANCGVELPTVDVISGRLIGCSSASGDADALLKTKALAVIRGKEHTQVGAGFDRSLWCLLFSSGSANSTFLLEAAGKGIKQMHGCFSAPDPTWSCSAVAVAAPPNPTRLAAMAVLLLFLSYH